MGMKLVAASCSRLQSVNPQPVWAEIEAEKPDALLLLGDNVYLDEDRHDDPARLAADLRALYQRQLAEPNFAALLAGLRKRKATVAAIYDDHDFLGDNRSGGEAAPALREGARRQLIDAFAPLATDVDADADADAPQGCEGMGKKCGGIDQYQDPSAAEQCSRSPRLPKKKKK